MGVLGSFLSGCLQLGRSGEEETVLFSLHLGMKGRSCSTYSPEPRSREESGDTGDWQRPPKPLACAWARLLALQEQVNSFPVSSCVPAEQDGLC